MCIGSKIYLTERPLHIAAFNYRLNSATKHALHIFEIRHSSVFFHNTVVRMKKTQQRFKFVFKWYAINKLSPFYPMQNSWYDELDGTTKSALR